MVARIGVFGGTFDPVHYGHLAIAEEARIALNLERVLFVPAAQQPLKHGHHAASALHRLAMARLACQSNSAFEVSTTEIERAGISYTVTTLEVLRTQLNAELFFIFGADALEDLPRWHRAAELPTLARLLAVTRPGTHVDLTALLKVIPTLEGRVQLLEGPQLELSSTELRQRVAAGRPLRYLVPDAVVEYIERYGLYRHESALGGSVKYSTEL